MVPIKLIEYGVYGDRISICTKTVFYLLKGKALTTKLGIPKPLTLLLVRRG